MPEGGQEKGPYYHAIDLSNQYLDQEKERERFDIGGKYCILRKKSNRQARTNQRGGQNPCPGNVHNQVFRANLSLSWNQSPSIRVYVQNNCSKRETCGLQAATRDTCIYRCCLARILCFTSLNCDMHYLPESLGTETRHTFHTWGVLRRIVRSNN